jgi:outer membrane protein
MAMMTAGSGDTLARPPDPNSPKYTQSLGGGIVVVPQPYEGVGTSVVPVPLADLSYHRFYIEGIDAGFRWRERALLGYRVFVGPRFMGYDAADSNALAGMDDRDFSGDAGIGVTLRPILNLDVDLLLPLGGWLLRPSAGLQWQSDEMVDYYYGVARNEARPGRPAYGGEAALSWFVEIEASRRVGERWTFVAGLISNRLAGEIAGSPVVDGNRSESGYMGFLFGF